MSVGTTQSLSARPTSMVVASGLELESGVTGGAGGGSRGRRESRATNTAFHS